MLPSGYECVVNITDTAGQQEYTSLRDHQLRHAEGFLLVYSICDATSFDEAKALKEAIERVNEHQTVATPVVLVGNKIDLEADRQVSTRDASAYATELGIPFFETSAKTSHGVEAAFHALITELRKFRAVSNAPPSPEQAADLAQSSAAGSASAGAQGDLSASGSKSSSSGGGRRRGRRGQSGDKGSSSGGSSGKLCILV
ncbi:hypothetical protein H696_03311 [Fonticula alba]|uniref:Ras family, other n=1 Tax=Fonticula alba TaxID=691883 RepID=A0A058Z7D3_FONAL|nr:hypothetical protein H696_03311 [Fonticula alba]KCV69838.1 hypothetical protein H696_03311 [Fonticula alba]|eukprot:XP_009495444.1 hypothetical protein H696_03311 [Fonticula alba]